jgi:hypothetical protein
MRRRPGQPPRPLFRFGRGTQIALGLAVLAFVIARVAL